MDQKMQLLQQYKEDKQITFDAVWGASTMDSCKEVKFTKPEIDQGQSLEVRVNSFNKWEEYRPMSGLAGSNIRSHNVK